MTDTRNEYEAMARTICSLLDKKLGRDIVCLDVHEQTVITDYFVVCSGRNPAQVKALYDEVEDKMAAQGHFLLRSEGYSEGRWAVMDFGSVIVHIFHEQEREFYHLERLWDNGQNRLTLELDDDKGAQDTDNK